MAALLRVALALAHLAAATVPCPSADAATPSPEVMRAYASAALHAHGAVPESPDGELRAPCACGCDETPAGRIVSTPLGAALVAAQAAPELPSAAHPAAPPPRIARTLGQSPDPVPRPA